MLELCSMSTGIGPRLVPLMCCKQIHSHVILLLTDFQQIEFRLLAHLSSDRELLSIFNENSDTDIYIQLTAQWYLMH